MLKHVQCFTALFYSPAMAASTAVPLESQQRLGNSTFLHFYNLPMSVCSHCLALCLLRLLEQRFLGHLWANCAATR